MIRVSVDFNTMQVDARERVNINIATHPNLSESLSLGQRVVLVEPDLEVEANLEFDVQDGEWWGVPDWSTRRDLPYP